MDAVAVFFLVCSSLIGLAIIFAIKNTFFSKKTSNHENIQPENFIKDISLDLNILGLLFSVTIVVLLAIFVTHRTIYLTEDILLAIMIIVGAVESMYYLVKRTVKLPKLYFKFITAVVLSIFVGSLY